MMAYIGNYFENIKNSYDLDLTLFLKMLNYYFFNREGLNCQMVDWLCVTSESHKAYVFVINKALSNRSQ